MPESSQNQDSERLPGVSTGNGDESELSQQCCSRQNTTTILTDEIFFAPFTLNRENYKKNTAAELLKNDQVRVSPFYEYSVTAVSGSYEIKFQLVSDTQSRKKYSEIEHLKEFYKFLNSNEIVLHISQNLDLIYFLGDISNKIIQYFNFQEVSEVSLELIYDTDISDSPILELRITTSGDVDSVLLNKESFDEEFWFLSSFNLIKHVIIGFNFK